VVPCLNKTLKHNKILLNSFIGTTALNSHNGSS